MPLFFRVEFKGGNYRVDVDNVNSVPSAIEEELEISLQNYHLQYQDKDFDNNWINVGKNLRVIENTSHIRIVEKKGKLLNTSSVLLLSYI